MVELYKFALFGDSRSRDKPLWKILEDLRKRKDLRFACHTGDVVAGENRKTKFEEYLSRLEEIPFSVYTTRGNHDVNVFPSDEFPDIERWETWKVSGFKKLDRYLKLDNSTDHWGKKQKEFIEKWLEPSARNFIFTHKPLDDVVFPDGRRVSHIMGNTPKGNEDAQWLRRIASRNNVEMFGVGHYHFFAVQMLKENILTLLEGRAGAPEYGKKVPFGYSIIYVWPDSWTIQKIDLDI